MINVMKLLVQRKRVKEQCNKEVSSLFAVHMLEIRCTNDWWRCEELFSKETSSILTVHMLEYIFRDSSGESEGRYSVEVASAFAVHMLRKRVKTNSPRKYLQICNLHASKDVPRQICRMRKAVKNDLVLKVCSPHARKQVVWQLERTWRGSQHEDITRFCCPHAPKGSEDFYSEEALALFAVHMLGIALHNSFWGGKKSEERCSAEISSVSAVHMPRNMFHDSRRRREEQCSTRISADGDPGGGQRVMLVDGYKGSFPPRRKVFFFFLHQQSKATLESNPILLTVRPMNCIEVCLLSRHSISICLWYYSTLNSTAEERYRGWSPIDIQY